MQKKIEQEKENIVFNFFSEIQENVHLNKVDDKLNTMLNLKATPSIVFLLIGALRCL